MYRLTKTNKLHCMIHCQH